MSIDPHKPHAGDAGPERGFSVSEFETRLARAQSAMADLGVDGLFLTTEPEIRYFTGFLSRFWLSPTRPWFLLVPIDRQTCRDRSVDWP
jgi:Xaa-Pro dipeptidase